MEPTRESADRSPGPESDDIPDVLAVDDLPPRLAVDEAPRAAANPYPGPDTAPDCGPHEVE